MWLGCAGPQTAGGVAQVGRDWEGGRRGRRRRKEGGDRMRNREKERDPHRDTCREMGRQRQGNRETERDRNRRVYGRQCTHTQRQKHAHGDGERVRERRDRRDRERDVGHCMCSEQISIAIGVSSRVKAMQWGGAGAESIISCRPLCTLCPQQHLDTREIRFAVNFEGSHKNDKQERECFICGTRALQQP